MIKNILQNPIKTLALSGTIVAGIVFLAEVIIMFRNL